MGGKSIVKKVLIYIEENLRGELSLDSIERELCYSRFYLNRLFAKETGCTIYRYIRMRRLTEAARRLIQADAPIVEIAHEAGYDSQQAFTLAFRQAYLCTPQAYRKRGVFYPKQSKIILEDRACLSKGVWVTGGRAAA